MIVLDIIAFVLLLSNLIVAVYAIYLFIIIVWAIYVSEDNCKGCPYYPRRCSRCRVYKNMDKETKETWIDSKK